MAEKGIWQRATERKLGVTGDNMLVLKQPLEAIDGLLLSYGFGIIDNVLIEKLIKSEETKAELRIMFGELVEKEDLESAKTKAVEIQQRIANIPNFDDEFEKEIVGQIAGGVMNYLLKIIQDNQTV